MLSILSTKSLFDDFFPPAFASLNYSTLKWKNGVLQFKVPLQQQHEEEEEKEVEEKAHTPQLVKWLLPYPFLLLLLLLLL